MTRDGAQAEAERLFSDSCGFAFVFEVPRGFVIGKADRGGGWCRNFRELGFGESWELALDNAKQKNIRMGICNNSSVLHVKDAKCRNWTPNG